MTRDRETHAPTLPTGGAPVEGRVPAARGTPAPARLPPAHGILALFRLAWNETTWIAGGLFAILSLIVLTAQGVRADSRVVFLMEVAFPLLAAPLAAPLALFDLEYGMAEVLNAAPTPSSIRIARRLAQVLSLPVALAVPLTAVLGAIIGLDAAPGFYLMTGASAATLTLFAGGLAFAAATLCGGATSGYVAPPAFVILVITLKGSLPTAAQPFPMAATLGRSLAMFAAGPLAHSGVFWLNRAGYALGGILLMSLGLTYLTKSRWGY